MTIILMTANIESLSATIVHRKVIWLKCAVSHKLANELSLQEMTPSMEEQNGLKQQIRTP